MGTQHHLRLNVGDSAEEPGTAAPVHPAPPIPPCFPYGWDGRNTASQMRTALTHIPLLCLTQSLR